MIKLKIKTEKYINRKAAKISALLSGVYSPLGKAFEKQIKTIEDQGIKQVEALKALKLEGNKEGI